jgi:hypothetical protein
MNENNYLINNKLSAPDVRNYKETSLKSLPSNIFVNYIDILLNTHSELVCNIDLPNINEYFIEINVTNLTYKISNNFLLFLKSCTKELFIIPINLRFPSTFETTQNPYINTDGHSNIVIIDNKYQTIEFFEPHGIQYNGSNILYNIQLIIENVMTEVLPLESRFYTFKNVYSQCPYFGVQTNDSLCLAWSLLFIELRLINRKYLAEDIINIITTKLLDKKALTLQVYLSKYISYVLDKINKLLSSKQNYQSYPSNYLFNLNLNDIIVNPQQIRNRILLLLVEYNDISLQIKMDTILNNTNDNIEIRKNKRKIIFNELISYKNLEEFQDIFLNYFEDTCNNNNNNNNNNKNNIMSIDPFMGFIG